MKTKDVNYITLYKSLIESAKKRFRCELNGDPHAYSEPLECHHVLPKSWHGKNSDTNYAFLTHAEHQKAHVYLNLACIQFGEFDLLKKITMGAIARDWNVKYDTKIFRNVRVMFGSKKNPESYGTLTLRQAFMFLRLTSRLPEGARKQTPRALLRFIHHLLTQDTICGYRVKLVLSKRKLENFKRIIGS